MKASSTKAIPDSESVWDYPRPPRIEEIDWHLKIVHRGQVLAETRSAVRVLETSHPPSYYFPKQAIDWARLRRNNKTSLCEWKGRAEYWDLIDPEHAVIADCCWSYPNPARHELKDHVSFYAGRVDECYVNDERVQAQAGNFYGGWVTSWLKGPFKGAPGTLGW